MQFLYPQDIQQLDFQQKVKMSNFSNRGPEMDIILRNMEDLSEEEFRELKFYLRAYGGVPKTKLDNADRRHVVQLMVEYAPLELMKYIRMIFEQMDRKDLLELLTVEYLSDFFTIIWTFGKLGHFQPIALLFKVIECCQ